MITVCDSQRTTKSYCSPECRSRKVDHTCPGCGVAFSVTPSRLRLAQETFCSKLCWRETYRRRNHSPAICARCGGTFLSRNCQTKRGRGKYCSFACLKADRTPEHPSKPRLGTTGWRSAVLRADNRNCRRCGATENLHAHHIKPWAKYPDLRYVLDNGVTLCETCHSVEHQAVSA